LRVEYPEGIGPDNPPKGWVPLVYDHPEGQDIQTFHWPERKHYLSRSGAEGRASILRDYGCTVTIERSEPVAWPDA
jgi:hypothetical protein